MTEERFLCVTHLPRSCPLPLIAEDEATPGENIPLDPPSKGELCLKGGAMPVLRGILEFWGELSTSRVGKGPKER